MSEDSFTKTTTEGWFSRIGKSFMGFIIGPILIIGSVILLGWNEGNTAHTAAALNDARKEVITVSPDSIDAANDKKLVYLTGLATAEETLYDEDFEVEQEALVLRRKVQVYVWKESESSKTEKNLGGSETTTTKYTYEKVWSDSLIDSSKFEKKEGHQNPPSVDYKSATFVAKDAHIGAFHLPREIVEKIEDEKSIKLTQSDEGEDELIIHDNSYYLGEDPEKPQIGDLKVSFSYVPPTTASIVAKQVDKGLEYYVSKNGTTISLVKAGTHSSDALIDGALDDNNLVAWIIRCVGLLVAIAGFASFLQPLRVFADVVPFIGSIVGFGTGFVSFVLGFVVAVSTIAIAWLVYRPLIGIALLALCVAALILLYRRKKPSVAVA